MPTSPMKGPCGCLALSHAENKTGASASTAFSTNTEHPTSTHTGRRPSRSSGILASAAPIRGRMRAALAERIVRGDRTRGRPFVPMPYSRYSTGGFVI